MVNNKFSLCSCIMWKKNLRHAGSERVSVDLKFNSKENLCFSDALRNHWWTWCCWPSSFPPSLTVNTHCHADHITSTGLMKKRMVGLKSAISKFSGASADIHLLEGDKITFGKHVRGTFSSLRRSRAIHVTMFCQPCCVDVKWNCVTVFQM